MKRIFQRIVAFFLSICIFGNVLLVPASAVIITSTALFYSGVAIVALCLGVLGLRQTGTDVALQEYCQDIFESDAVQTAAGILGFAAAYASGWLPILLQRDSQEVVQPDGSTIKKTVSTTYIPSEILQAVANEAILSGAYTGGSSTVSPDIPAVSGMSSIPVYTSMPVLSTSLTYYADSFMASSWRTYDYLMENQYKYVNANGGSNMISSAYDAWQYVKSKLSSYGITEDVPTLIDINVPSATGADCSIYVYDMRKIGTDYSIGITQDRFITSGWKITSMFFSPTAFESEIAYEFSDRQKHYGDYYLRGQSRAGYLVWKYPDSDVDFPVYALRAVTDWPNAKDNMIAFEFTTSGKTATLEREYVATNDTFGSLKSAWILGPGSDLSKLTGGSALQYNAIIATHYIGFDEVIQPPPDVGGDLPVDVQVGATTANPIGKDVINSLDELVGKLEGWQDYIDKGQDIPLAGTGAASGAQDSTTGLEIDIPIAGTGTDAGIVDKPQDMDQAQDGTVSVDTDITQASENVAENQGVVNDFFDWVFGYVDLDKSIFRKFPLSIIYDVYAFFSVVATGSAPGVGEIMDSTPTTLPSVTQGEAGQIPVLSFPVKYGDFIDTEIKLDLNEYKDTISFIRVCEGALFTLSLIWYELNRRKE